MLLQEGVPLKTACGWKSGMCPTFYGSRSLPVILELVSLCLEVREISLHLVVSVAGTKASLHFFFSAVMLVEVCRGQICFMMNPMTSLSLLPSPLQEPHCPAWQSTPFQPVVHLPHAWLQQPAACPLPLTPPSWSAGPGEISSLIFVRKLLPAFPCKSWGMPEHRVHLKRVTGTCWDLARFTPTSAPPYAGNSQIFNYSPLREAAEDTGDFDGSWLGTSAASSS